MDKINQNIQAVLTSGEELLAELDKITQQMNKRLAATKLMIDNMAEFEPVDPKLVKETNRMLRRANYVMIALVQAKHME